MLCKDSHVSYAYQSQYMIKTSVKVLFAKNQTKLQIFHNKNHRWVQKQVQYCKGATHLPLGFSAAMCFGLGVVDKQPI